MIIRKRVEGGHCYLLYNDAVTLNILESMPDYFHQGIVAIFYHLDNEILLIHVFRFFNDPPMESVLELTLDSIEHDNIHTEQNDKKIRSALNEPLFTTRETLASFLRSELEKL